LKVRLRGYADRERDRNIETTRVEKIGVTILAPFDIINLYISHKYV